MDKNHTADLHCNCDKNKAEKDSRLYSGVAVDIADKGDVTSEAVKDYTKELNNNPRNDD